jgi:LmbE family N-acetylglucosaminyl deacetylase
VITAADFWAAAQALPLADLAMIAPGRAFVLAPHPDDESLGCGGLIAEACARGNPPIVAVLTDGTQSHPNSRQYPAGRLRAVREGEVMQAAARLGVPPDCVLFLRYRDTEAPADGPALLEAAARVAALVRRYDCRAILAPWRHDPHCDHEAAHRIAALAAQAAAVMHRAYPVWGLTLPADTELDAPPRGLRLDMTPHRAAKREAILSHASQYAGLIGDDPDGFQMQPAFMALFDSGIELYLEP